MTEFKIGDVVALKGAGHMSGEVSPRDFKPGDVVGLMAASLVTEMVVNRRTTDGLECVWIDDWGHPHREVYNPAVLRKKEPEKK